jgi:RecA-family ATPase
MVKAINYYPVREALHSISASELYDTVYTPRQAVIENLLYAGTYLFVGAPKVGKSFLMAQIAYHVSLGADLCDYPVRQGTVLYLALEDDYGRLQKRFARMYGTGDNESL